MTVFNTGTADTACFFCKEYFSNVKHSLICEVLWLAVWRLPYETHVQQKCKTEGYSVKKAEYVQLEHLYYLI